MKRKKTSSLMGNFKLIDLGPINDFIKRLNALQESVKNRWIRFAEMQENSGFWLFEDENDDEIVGGILHVEQGRVYAISQDVANLVEESFARK
jgi:hypothetical protein